MTEGFGYIDGNGVYVFEGYEIEFRCESATVLIVPVAIAWPDIGDDPNNQVTFKVHVAASGFAGEILTEGPLSIVHRLRADLAAWPMVEEIQFPSRDAVVYVRSKVEVSLKVVNESALVTCVIGEPCAASLAGPFCSVESFRATAGQKSVALALSCGFLLDAERISIAKHQCDAFLRWVCGLRDNHSQP